MAQTQPKHEYIVRHVEGVKYEVLKFSSLEGGEQPLATYNVVWDPSRGRGKCDCPAGTYRGTGANDKHVKIVQEWLSRRENEGGNPTTIVV